MEDSRPRHSANVRRVSVYSSRRNSAVSSSSRGSSGSGQRAGSRSRQQETANSYDDGHVKVAVRCRPMSQKEMGANFESIVDFESESRIVVHDVSEQPGDQLGTKSNERRNISHVYDFDHVFDDRSSQTDVYDTAVRPLIDQVLLGFNCTVFAYGQTGTGKTYTMEGRTHSSSRRDSSTAAAAAAASRRRRSSSSDAPSKTGDGRDETSDDQTGMIPRTFEQIFGHVAAHPEIKFLIRASYLEIYQEEIRDLLKRDAKVKLELHERSDIGVYVKDLTSFVCKSMSEIERVMHVGNQNRIVAATNMNEHSSRSHAIFMITIEQQQQQQQQHATEELRAPLADTKLQLEARGTNIDVNNKNAAHHLKATTSGVIRVGKLNLVDLAGSERQRKTNSFGQRQKEAIKINLSLSALGNVINSLVRLEQQRNSRQLQAKSSHDDNNELDYKRQHSLIHTSYRDSKLTRLLQDSLGGNAKTLMIAHIGPASYNYDETINTLNYASRARCIRNTPRLNEDPKDALLRELQREIDLLRAKLASSSSAHPDDDATGDSSRDITRRRRRSQSIDSSANLGAADSTTTTAAAAAEKSQEERQNERLIEKEFFELKQKLASIESKILNSEKSSATSVVGVVGAQARSNSLSPLRLNPGAAIDHQSILKGLTREQELELAQRQEQLAAQVARERAIRDELERREELELMAKQSFESVQQEVEAKRKLIWKVLLRAKALRDEIGTAQQAYSLELDELDQLQGVLQRELKLKCLIMDNFIPSCHVDQLLSRVSYDERRNVCAIALLELPGGGKNAAENDCCFPSGGGGGSSGPQAKLNFADYWRPTLGDSIRPKSEMERMGEAVYPSNIRYKYDNLLEPSLEFKFITSDHEGDKKTSSSSTRALNTRRRRLCDKLGGATDAPGTGPPTGRQGDARLQVLIDEALNRREPDIVI